MTSKLGLDPMRDQTAVAVADQNGAFVLVKDLVKIVDLAAVVFATSVGDGLHAVRDVHRATVFG